MEMGDFFMQCVNRGVVNKIVMKMLKQISMPLTSLMMNCEFIHESFCY